MISARLRPIRRILSPIPTTRATEEARDLRHDPADLAATLRDLAARAHRAVRAFDAAPDAEALGELVALHPRIVELQQGLDGGPQEGLASYLSALRREVESRLG